MNSNLSVLRYHDVGVRVGVARSPEQLTLRPERAGGQLRLDLIGQLDPGQCEVVRNSPKEHQEQQ